MVKTTEKILALSFPVYPKSSLNSSRTFNVPIIGLSFDDINHAKRVRRDFFRSPILLKRYGLARLPMGAIFKPQDIRKNREATLLQENVAVPYLELGSKFNFSIWVAEDYSIMSGKRVEIELTNTRTPFVMQLWRLTGLTMAAMAVVLVRHFKSWRMGWLLAFYIIGTLMVKGQTL